MPLVPARPQLAANGRHRAPEGTQPTKAHGESASSPVLPQRRRATPVAVALHEREAGTLERAPDLRLLGWR